MSLTPLGSLNCLRGGQEVSQYGDDGSAHSPLMEGDTDRKKQNWRKGVAGVLGCWPLSSSVVRWRKNELAQKEAEEQES